MVLLLIFSANVSYGDGIKRSDVFEHFRDIAIFKDSADLYYPIQKWETPIRFGTILSSPNLSLDPLEETLDVILPNVQTIEFSFVPRNPNFLLLYGDNQKEIFAIHEVDLRSYLGNTDYEVLKNNVSQNGNITCYGNLYKNDGGLSKAIVIIDSSLEQSQLRKCASMTMLTNLGFIGNRDQFNNLKSASVLLNNSDHDLPTMMDKIALQLLYSKEIKYGMAAQEALKKVRKILKEN